MPTQFKRPNHASTARRNVLDRGHGQPLSKEDAQRSSDGIRPQTDLPHVENVRLVEDATTSGGVAAGFDGRYALPLGLALLGVFLAIAYLFSV
jgi:hypothetical protein